MTSNNIKGCISDGTRQFLLCFSELLWTVGVLQRAEGFHSEKNESLGGKKNWEILDFAQNSTLNRKHKNWKLQRWGRQVMGILLWMGSTFPRRGARFIHVKNQTPKLASIHAAWNKQPRLFKHYARARGARVPPQRSCRRFCVRPQNPERKEKSYLKQGNTTEGWTLALLDMY